jgi:hypothetical protein
MVGRGVDRESSITLDHGMEFSAVREFTEIKSNPSLE